MVKKYCILTAVLLLTTLSVNAQPGQIAIPRIEQMPNQPAPYNMRNWRDVALGYDSFVYDITKTGQYLPFVRLTASGVNYPQNPGFGLHTYVGTNSPLGNEAINVLPSLVGATLSGIDKSNQFGKNWVLMSQDFFNKNNGELIYLNSPASGSGNDWWYDVMPNVYFYQLYDLYPNIGGDAAFQFTSVADRFLESVRDMGGSDAPWQKPFMNYRAWNFKTRMPNTTSVPEPEAAGAYAWLLYNAYMKTGNPAYLQGAEWCMEFLSAWTSNPSYELQLPYGTYTAARMNAELGTQYDIEKMVNWSFDRGALRGWGAIVGTWGSYNVSGLIGEANDGGNDYAFQMNGVQQAAMLAPMVRYDKRFARAVGKWVLNLANATRLFYRGFLPSSLQDAATWSNTYDPDRVIGYEALREKYQGNSPYATGDAVGGGWANTNLALYGTSSIGYLGAILEKTNVNAILKIDLLKTDFYKGAAYPTFLLYNPYSMLKTVALKTGNSPVDVYDALTESFLLQGVTGTIQLDIPADAALMVTLTPASGNITYDQNKMLVNGIAVDYRQSFQPFDYAPRIQALATSKKVVEFGDSTAVFSKIDDQDSNNFSYTWSADGGTFTGTGATVQWHAPQVVGNYTITLIVSDENNNRDTATVSVATIDEINLAPVLGSIQKNADYLLPGATLQLNLSASDPNGDPLTFVWTSAAGVFNGNGSSIDWTAPTTEGIYTIQVLVSDGKGLSASASTSILVKQFSAAVGDIIAHYPFVGNTLDVSGNMLHGQSSGALPTSDFWGNANNAYSFDGINDNISVANQPILNFQNAITVSCWFKPRALPERESFLLSHGSWQNRWKISITPDNKIRWTLNSLAGVGDLDSDIILQIDSVYHLAVTYDGSLMALFVNGKLNSYKPLSGLIRSTSVAFLLGQILPGNTEFNFKGILDAVKIYDYALHPDAVQALYNSSVSAVMAVAENKPMLLLSPNPVIETLHMSVSGSSEKAAQVSIFNVDGILMTSQRFKPETVFKIDTKHWKSGAYIAVYQSETTRESIRFVKL
jgi:hypothetical protein